MDKCGSGISCRFVSLADRVSRNSGHGLILSWLCRLASEALIQGEREGVDGECRLYRNMKFGG